MEKKDCDRSFPASSSILQATTEESRRLKKKAIAMGWFTPSNETMPLTGATSRRGSGGYTRHYINPTGKKCVSQRSSSHIFSPTFSHVSVW